MKKKIIAVLLIAVMSLSFSACSVRKLLLEGDGDVYDFAREINAVLEGRVTLDRSPQEEAPPKNEQSLPEDSTASPSEQGPAEQEAESAPEDTAPQTEPSPERPTEVAGYPVVDRSPHVPFAPVDHGDVDYSQMSYYLYDSDQFIQMCDELAASTDVGAAIEIYNSLYEELKVIKSQYTICYLQYCADIENEKLQEDQLECESIATECFDAFCIAVRDCLNGPVGTDFTLFLGEEAAEAYMEYEELTDRESELAEEEAELIALYYEQIEQADSYTFFYEGKNWTMEMLQGSESRTLSYTEWYKVYDGIQAAINADVGEIFLQLVDVRHEIAQLAGYESYADYAYENLYDRDYTTADAQVFCDSVKEAVAVDFYDNVYSSNLLYSDFSYDTELEEMIAILGELCYSFDGRLGEAWEYFYSHDLYSISDAPSMRQGGFTTTISMYNAPYIHIALSGQVSDMGTLIHEFGHFSDAYWNQPGDLILDSGSYDIFEIHSTGLEVLFLEYYPQIFGSRSVQAEFYTLLNLLYCVVDGCLYDEFQRIVYGNPDMTLDEINQLYYDLSVQYGQPQATDVDYYWMYVHHNFEAPMYYLSYAVSALASLQIWDLQQLDPDAALDLYIEILGLGAYEYGYMELMDAVGLVRFSQEGSAGEICTPVIEYCAALEDRD